MNKILAHINHYQQPFSKKKKINHIINKQLFERIQVFKRIINAIFFEII